MLLPVLEVVARRALAVTVVVAPPAQLVAPGSRAPNLTRPALLKMTTNRKQTYIFLALSDIYTIFTILHVVILFPRLHQFFRKCWKISWSWRPS